MTDDVKAQVERDGMPDAEITCPVCGAQCALYYLNLYNEIVGCEDCIHSEYAELVQEDMSAW